MGHFEQFFPKSVLLLHTGGRELSVTPWNFTPVLPRLGVQQSQAQEPHMAKAAHRNRLCAALSIEHEQAQEVCSGLFVLDKLFAPFVLLSDAELGRDVEAGQHQSKRSISVPEMWCCETGRREWDKRNGVKEIVEKPMILTVIVMMNLGIAFLMKDREF